jgi:DNA-binding response OmpR family regulator
VRILIVEDDAAMARGLAERLKLSGFAVDIESDGASAAQTALLEPYSLIILDINLPNVSGFEVLHKIRQTGSTVPVMILTARYAIDDKVSGLDLGADDYLSKPFDISEFDARVRALVRRGQGLPNPTDEQITRRPAPMPLALIKKWLKGLQSNETRYSTSEYGETQSFQTSCGGRHDNQPLCMFQFAPRRRII